MHHARGGSSISVTVSTDLANLDLDAIHRILSGTYWSPDIRREVVAEALRNSITAVAIDDATGDSIGLVHVVTDRATFAWLCDIFVIEAWRGQGSSRHVMEIPEPHSDLRTLRLWCLATHDAHGVFEKFGYRSVPVDRWMENPIPAERWSVDRQTP